MKMEVLQAFVAVAERRSFSKAGEELYLSQPTVSRYIREMEKSTGGALFVRDAHSCELTLLGKQVFVHAKRIINEWQAIEKLKDESRATINENVRIGYTYHLMMLMISDAMMKMNQKAEDVEISVHFGDGADISRLIREGKLECGVMHLPSVSNPDGLAIRLISRCDMCVQVPQGHRLAAYDQIKLEQLIHETDVRIQREIGFYRMADEAFAMLNLPPMKHIYVERASDCLPIVLHRNRLCLSPSIYPPWPGCKKVIIEDWTTDFSLVFVTKEKQMCENVEKIYRALCSG